MIDYYEGIGVTIPQRVNPADFLLELVNIDFSQDINAASQSIADLQSLWQASSSAQLLCESILATDHSSEGLSIHVDDKPSIGGQLMTLLQRSFLKAYRDAMTYKFRLVMYMGLAILMGTIWLQLDRNQDSIQLLINALLVSCGFMAFMAVTYVPAFIEDHQQYIHEHRNGLYGETVLNQFGYKTEDQKQNIGIVIIIILGYRLASWTILKLKH